MMPDDRAFTDFAHIARPTRRQALCTAAAAALCAVSRPVSAQMVGLADNTAPFSFDWLTERMRQASREAYRAPRAIEGPLADLSYDAYRAIRFRPDQSRWAEENGPFTLQAFHPGWLFPHPVAVHEVVDGEVRDLNFSAADFEYGNGLDDRGAPALSMPGVAGFRVHAPLNRPDVYDEVIAFLGASYFRALGRGNLYGLSARGLALNTGVGGVEEFPRFSAFWIERPPVGADSLVINAALESPSVTGAYRFVVIPGETTKVDVTARLFFRKAVKQLGIAPLTSMYLFGPNDPGPFDDYRSRVHDSEMLVLETGGGTYVRPLTNPPRLANSYLGARSPQGFGLIQRSRAFDDYLDAGAHYERRPSLWVEPLGDWGEGAVRLVEIPSDLEANDNIVAFWVKSEDVAAGDALEYSYRLNWSMSRHVGDSRIAYVLRTLAGHGGVSGLKPKEHLRKFAIDFAGGDLAELSPDTPVEARVHCVNGELGTPAVSRIEGADIWRLVFEVDAEPGSVVELQAAILHAGQQLTETWLYQWIDEE